MTRFEWRYFLCYIVLLLVGLGSLLFHMTLKWFGQLLDEIPMLIELVPLSYSILEFRKTGRANRTLVAALVAYVSLAVAYYVLTE